MHELVNKFLKENARLCITVGSYEERLNVAPKAIFVEGNVEGFRSLSEIFALYLNELEDILPVSDFPFVTNKMPKSFAVRFLYGDQIEQPSDGSVVESADGFEWRLTETEAAVVAISLHGLGYAYEHLHFDPVLRASEYAVFCGLAV